MFNCTDVTIIATGHLVWEALIAAEIRRKRYLPKSSIFTIIKP
jgi:transketolase C-terminal domain/subunit